MEIAVIGLGLIGGSLLRALTAAGHRVSAFDADPATRAAVTKAAGSSPTMNRWQVTETVRAAVARAELVVVAVPLPALAQVLNEVAEAGYTGLVTDVTSVKVAVRELADQHLPRRAAAPAAPPTAPARFVGGHPMAGRETSGFGAADPALFTGCAWVLCLEPEFTPLADWLALAALLTGLGARVVPATAAEHDRAVAAVSHVPHLLAAALAAAAENPLAATLAAGSFRDGTRVAASRPELVAAMCGGNASAVGPALDAVLAALRQARAAVDTQEPISALRDWLAPRSAVRADWPSGPGLVRELPADADALLRLGRAGGWVSNVADDRRTVTAVTPAEPGSQPSP